MSAPALSRTALLVEDDPDIIRLVSLHIGELGVQLDVSSNGREAVEKALANPYDLLLLDLNVPGLGGVEICKQVRAKKPLLPIMMLTSKSEEIDKVVGFQVGADDYVVKPFSTRELLARIGALLRRSEAAASRNKSDAGDGGVIRAGSIEIQVDRRQVLLDGVVQNLTPTEFDLLTYLARNPNRTFTRAQLVEDVLGYAGSGYERTINSHMSRLRAKLEKDPDNPQFITTVWGVGYCFVLPEE